MTPLYLMVARGGSKGVPRKNLREICGHSLIAWKAATVRAYDPDARIVISTDDTEIANEAGALGIDVPWLRPAELATDTATTDSVIAHALDNIDNVPDAVFLLEPSSPFQAPHHYAAALERFTSWDAALVCGMRECYPHTSMIGDREPNRAKITDILDRVNAMGDTRRQAQNGQWTINGTVYLFSAAVFRETGHIYGTPARSHGFLMDRWHSHEIEDEDDLELARMIAEKGWVKYYG